jgi:hypothetical protein
MKWPFDLVRDITLSKVWAGTKLVECATRPGGMGLMDVALVTLKSMKRF